MSALEPHERDQVNYEAQQTIWQQIEDEKMAEFRELLETAFAFANDEGLNQDEVFVQIRTVFKDHFDKCDMIVSKGYRFEELGNTLIRSRK